jgi:uncharacterized protein YqfA (UPF0365 family)
MILDVAILLVLIAIAILLLLREIVFRPGITIAGIGSAIFAVGGILYAYGISPLVGHITLGGSVLVFAALFVWMVRGKAFRKISLNTDISSTVLSARDMNIKPGDEGLTLSRLAPIGKARFNNITVEAKSTGEFIAENVSVVVLRVDGYNVLVAAKDDINNSLTINIMDYSFIPVMLIGAAIVLLIIFFYYVPFLMWISAKVSGVSISLIQLFLMRIRKVPPGVITRAMIEAHKAGLKSLTRDELEAHYLAGGHVERVVHALVSASKANIDLTFQMATAIDLAGRDVFLAVQMSVNPKVIDTPPVTAVAKDGIQLIAKARVTVRANIKQLVGGAGEETILARVGEGIVSSIGSSENHKSVLENPDSISKLVLRKGLDAGTAFEILSIDIADIDIGKNIGAALQMDQAQADKNIAQAKAEERRAMAVALEQEMKAKAQEARAKVIEAEAEVPKAMAEAFRSGNMGIMDYYKMKNIEADTSMRENIAKPASDPSKPIKD